MTTPLFHLAVAEQLVIADSDLSISRYPGEFYFGALAPSVGLAVSGLTPTTTHFIPQDSTGSHFTQRTAIAISEPARWLNRPLSVLTSRERAFALGYLCHLAADEAFDPSAERFHHEALEDSHPLIVAWRLLLDVRSAERMYDRGAILAAIAESSIPSILPFATQEDLQALREQAIPYLSVGGGIEAAAYVLQQRGRSPEEIATIVAQLRQHWREVETAHSQFDMRGVMLIAVDRAVRTIDQFLTVAEAAANDLS